MSPTGPLEESYVACRQVMRANASTFSLAVRLLPRERRRATVALYGLFRTLDDVVDEAGAGRLAQEQAGEELCRWQRWLAASGSTPPRHPVVPAFLDTVSRFEIPFDYFIQLTDGLTDDIANRRYASFDELALYCYRVASTVGLAMCRVLGVTDPVATGHAAELGVAMQLTNILRDVREDLEQGRVYLPQDELAAAGWDKERMRTGVVDDAFRALMRRQIARARCYYARGAAGLPYLSPDARFSILVAARVYGGILDEIERHDYDVFSGRVRVPTARKLRIMAGCLLERRRYRRPVADAAGLGPGEPSGLDLIGAAHALRASPESRVGRP